MDKLADIGFGCISERVCPHCHIQLVCDSSGKAGTKVGNTRYVWGPCCCGLNTCPECGKGGIQTNLDNQPYTKALANQMFELINKNTPKNYAVKYVEPKMTGPQPTGAELGQLFGELLSNYSAGNQYEMIVTQSNGIQLTYQFYSGHDGRTSLQSIRWSDGTINFPKPEEFKNLQIAASNYLEVEKAMFEFNGIPPETPECDTPIVVGE